MTWFATLTGFSERDVGDVAAKFIVDGDMLESRANGRRMHYGQFETPTLTELRARLLHSAPIDGHLRFREVVADAQSLHADPSNAGAVFQVASQFNTLEMVGPAVTPEHGIDGYETDLTQGPACAIACGAGTIFRNYLVPLDGHVGQTAARQINCLADVAHALGQEIPMRNGSALPDPDQLQRIESTLAGLTDSDRDALIAQLRIGVQWNTEVTLPGAGHRVTQVYCSALPITYSHIPTDKWERFAQLILDATYEATLTVAALNAQHSSNRMVFLTPIGGGAFGNPQSWIITPSAGPLRSSPPLTSTSPW